MTARRNLLVFILVAIHLAAYLVILVFGFGTSLEPLEVEVSLGVFFSQWSLLSLWVGLATPQNLPRILVEYAVCFALWTVPFSGDYARLFGGVSIWIWACFPLQPGMVLLTMGIVALVAIVRAKGYRLQRFDVEEIPRGSGFQVSIRGLLAAMGLVAGMLAVGKCAPFSGAMHKGVWFTHVGPAPEPNWNGLAVNVVVVWVLLVVASGALLALRTSLSPGPVCSRMVAYALALSAAGLFVPYTLNGDAVTYIAWAMLPPGSFLMTVVSLLVFRSKGYRFLRVPAASDHSGDVSR